MVVANKKQSKTLEEKTNKMNEIIKECNANKKITKEYEKERLLLRETIDQGVLKNTELSE